MEKKEIYNQIKKWRECAKDRQSKHIFGEEYYLSLPHRSIRLLYYRGEAGEPTYFNLHGGGFVMGSPEDDDIFCHKVNKTLGMHVFNIDYPLAPEHPYPEDKEAVYEVIQNIITYWNKWNINHSGFVIGGHSAGANITAAICLMAKEKKDFSFLCQILDYPPLDLEKPPEQKIWVEGAIKPQIATLFNSAYCREDVVTEKFCSPIFATEDELKDLPDTLLITCEYDSLREEGELFGKRLIQAGVEVTGKRFLKRGHGFSMIDDENGREAMEYMIEYIRDKINRRKRSDFL